MLPWEDMEGPSVRGVRDILLENMAPMLRARKVKSEREVKGENILCRGLLVHRAQLTWETQSKGNRTKPTKILRTFENTVQPRSHSDGGVRG